MKRLIFDGRKPVTTAVVPHLPTQESVVTNTRKPTRTYTRITPKQQAAIAAYPDLPATQLAKTIGVRVEAVYRARAKASAQVFVAARKAAPSAPVPVPKAIPTDKTTTPYLTVEELARMAVPVLSAEEQLRERQDAFLSGIRHALKIARLQPVRERILKALEVAAKVPHETTNQ